MVSKNRPTELLLPGETTTTNFGWVKPSVGGSGDAWGGEWNTNLDAIDSTVAAIPRINRLDNGDMWVDQHNLGASVAVAANGGAYACDRWAAFNTKAKLTVGQNYNGYTRVAGFPFYLGVQTTGTTGAAASADEAYMAQFIEADTIGDLAFGTAAAQPITLSFWAIASITGTFGASVYSAGGSSYRLYPFTYTISAANAWTKIIVTVPGDIGGTTTTWPNAGSGLGMGLFFDLGSGASSLTATSGWQTTSAAVFPSGTTAKVAATNGNKWGVTGVKLEAGSVATPYQYETLSIKLARCQRYFQNCPTLVAGGYAAGGYALYASYTVPAMRIVPATPALAGITYTNTSSLTANVLATNSFYVSYTITATGSGTVSFSTSLSADL